MVFTSKTRTPIVYLSLVAFFSSHLTSAAIVGLLHSPNEENQDTKSSDNPNTLPEVSGAENPNALSKTQTPALTVSVQPQKPLVTEKQVRESADALALYLKYNLEHSNLADLNDPLKQLISGTELKGFSGSYLRGWTWPSLIHLPQIIVSVTLTSAVTQNPHDVFWHSMVAGAVSFVAQLFEAATIETVIENTTRIKQSHDAFFGQLENRGMLVPKSKKLRRQFLSLFKEGQLTSELFYITNKADLADRITELSTLINDATTYFDGPEEEVLSYLDQQLQKLNPWTIDQDSPKHKDLLFKEVLKFGKIKKTFLELAENLNLKSKGFDLNQKLITNQISSGNLQLSKVADSLLKPKDVFSADFLDRYGPTLFENSRFLWNLAIKNPEPIKILVTPPDRFLVRPLPPQPGLIELKLELEHPKFTVPVLVNVTTTDTEVNLSPLKTSFLSISAIAKAIDRAISKNEAAADFFTNDSCKQLLTAGPTPTKEEP